MRQGAQATIQSLRPNENSPYNDQGHRYAMTPDTDGYQTPGCCGATGLRFEVDETLTWGFDIGDEGLSNDLCMLWAGMGPDGYGALKGASRLYACDSMWTSGDHTDPATVSGCTLVEIHTHPDFGYRHSTRITAASTNLTPTAKSTGTRASLLATGNPSPCRWGCGRDTTRGSGLRRAASAAATGTRPS